MTHITPPKPSSSDSFLECQEAVEPGLQGFIAEAVKVGWSEPMVLAAVIEVAENLALAQGAGVEMEALLAQIRKLTD